MSPLGAYTPHCGPVDGREVMGREGGSCLDTRKPGPPRAPSLGTPPPEAQVLCGATWRMGPWRARLGRSTPGAETAGKRLQARGAWSA